MENQSNDPALMARNQKACQNACAFAAKPAARRVTKSGYETAASYVGIVAQLDDKHRVIICKDAIQWIIQVRCGQRCGQARWTGKSYLTTPEAVMAASHALCGPLRGKVLDLLRALPAKPEVNS